ncbi:hypothetical protein ACQKQC_06390 [Vibrio fortis]|uniref:hypothetical protein n=1 Tax=Vibrio fortis TaxID=212667 RepID=UPI004067F61D
MKPEIIEQIRTFVVDVATSFKSTPDTLRQLDEGKIPKLVIDNALELPIQNKLLIEIERDFRVGFYLTEILPHKPEIEDLYLARIWATLDEDSSEPSFNVHWSFDSSCNGLNIENKYWEDVFNTKMATQIEVSKWILGVVNGFRNRSENSSYNIILY